MCGIIGYAGRRESVPILLEGLKRLEYRGYDSAGVAVHDGSRIQVVKEKGRISILADMMEENCPKGMLGIGHTRWATHGVPSDVNSHPHFSDGERIAVVHNGIIENYAELKARLREKGYVFYSETDTETVSNIIDEYYGQSGDMLTAIRTALSEVRGSYALSILCADKPGTLYAARRDSPLIVGLGQGENYVASDVSAILGYTRDVYYLEEGDIAELTSDCVAVYDSAGQPVLRELCRVHWDAEAAERGGYEHFMLKEIFEQPKVIKDTFGERLRPDGVTLEGFTPDADMLRGVTRLYIVACGTAYHAGLIGKRLLEQTAHLPVICEVASEFRYSGPVIDGHSLMIVISQSGETADTLTALRMAKRAGARTLAIVNVVGSSIAREADDVIYTKAGPEISVASTKAFTAQLGALYLLALHMALKLGCLDGTLYNELREALRRVPSQIDEILNSAEHVRAMAEKYLRVRNVFYIGRGMDYLAAMEGALKIKEIAYLHAEAYAAGELKHGPIALIDHETLVLGLVTQPELYEKTVSNIRECQAREAKVFVIVMEGAGAPDFADDALVIPRTHPLIAPLLSSIPQQLFAYYVALGLGNDVDKPRNLAKSVTVE